VLVDGMGWTVFFFTTFLFALPGLVLLWIMREVVIRTETANES
jgi:hypothetical protein